ncbi:MAG: hypothetical protein COA79_05290 [Planctomycetota bacterium]|nr:MAG: hypothetical protein COA79_05290 [Planctomycetota bacterium]
MFFKNKKPEGFNREQSLKGIPVQNEGIKEVKEDKKLKIIYFRTSPMFQGIIERFNLPRSEKTIILDEIGAYIWHEIDGKQNTDKIIINFCKKYPMPRREAEVSIIEHLKNLMTRGAISIVFK